MTKTQKKGIIGGVLIGIFVISFISVVSDYPSIPSKDTRNIPEANSISQTMPEESSYTYGTNEYIIINDMMSKGMILKQYKRIFTNLTHKNYYDVADIYSDFDRDMEQYSRYLKEDIIKLQAMRPARDTSKTSQSDTLERAKRLYTKVSQYNIHESDINDTLNYLANCNYELERLSQQVKLPQG